MRPLCGANRLHVERGRAYHRLVLHLGHTTAKVTLRGPDPSRSEQVEILVDTGSTYTWVSKALLRRLKIGGRTARNFRSMDGSLLERRVGEAVVEYDGERATTIVVFAEECDAQVLGLHTLEGLGLEVYPTSRRLRKAETLLALSCNQRGSMPAGPFVRSGVIPTSPETRGAGAAVKPTEVSRFPRAYNAYITLLIFGPLRVDSPSLGTWSGSQPRIRQAVHAIRRDRPMASPAAT